MSVVVVTAAPVEYLMCSSQASWSRTFPIWLSGFRSRSPLAPSPRARVCVFPVCVLHFVRGVYLCFCVLLSCSVIALVAFVRSCRPPRFPACCSCPSCICLLPAACLLSSLVSSAIIFCCPGSPLLSSSRCCCCRRRRRCSRPQPLVRLLPLLSRRLSVCRNLLR